MVTTGVQLITTIQQVDGVVEAVKMVVDVLVLVEGTIIAMIMTAMMGRIVIAAVEEVEVDDQVGEELVVIGIQWVEDVRTISTDVGVDEEVMTPCR